MPTRLAQETPRPYQVGEVVDVLLIHTPYPYRRMRGTIICLVETTMLWRGDAWMNRPREIPVTYVTVDCPETGHPIVVPSYQIVRPDHQMTAE